MADTVFSTIDVAFPGGIINSITGDLGGRFNNLSGETVVITQLGRWVTSGNSHTHTLKIWDSSHTPIDSVVVNCSGAPSAQFLYGTLPLGPVSVAAGGSVYITSTEVSQASGGDTLSGPSVQGVTVTDIGTFDSVTLIGGVWTPASNSNRTFGPVTFKYSAPVISWTYNAGTNAYTMTGGSSFYQVKTALADSPNHAGSTVNIGAGTFTYFAGGSTLNIPAGIILSGDTAATTIINMSTGAVSGFSAGSITLNEGSIVRNLTINGPDVAVSGGCVPLITQFTAGTWRVSHVNYNQFANRSSYFILIQRAPTGLIDNCNIQGASGTSELIFSRGPNDAWQNPAGLGDANAVYVEKCTIGGVGQGYVNDANDNGKVVFRFNTITGGMKIDGHGRASTSVRGVRRTEAYFNNWTFGSTGGWLSFELRGGKNIVFNNTASIAGQGAGFKMSDYGYLGMYPGFLGRYQTPQNYPLLDQIGQGKDETVLASTIGLGALVTIATVGTTDFTAFGASSNTPGVQFFATGTPTGNGTITHNSTNDPSYVFGNLKNGSAWARAIASVAGSPSYITATTGYAPGTTSLTLNTVASKLYANNAVLFSNDATSRYLVTADVVNPGPKTLTISPGLVNSVPASAITVSATPNTLYQYQLGNSSSTFGETDIVQQNRDFYSDAGFDSGAAGVTVGTTIGAAPTAVGKTNQGYWAASEGSWNTENATPGTPGYQKGNGQLYVSNGTTWVLTYTPYTYPFSPVPPATPVFTSASVAASGTTLDITFSVSVSTGGGGAGGITVTASGGAVTWTFSIGAGTITYTGTLSRTIAAGEVLTVSYTQPGSGLWSTADHIEVASFGAQPVTNNSSINSVQAPGLRPLAALSGGF